MNDNELLQSNEIKERAIAIAFGKKGSNRDIAFDYLNELEDLAYTAGAEIIEKIYQELDKPNRATVIGKGKVNEVIDIIKENDITLVIFDDDLTPAQLRNLEVVFEVKVIDRSGLILDIFAKHAKTLEAKTQVELAQSQYLLPRLTRMWTHLSKQFGGIGTKGPGETQIEADRRALRNKIARLKVKLKNIADNKEQQRKGRADFPRFALVGYTNTGKSTLMNVITNAGVVVEDKLFATLDTTVRAFNFPNSQKALISDTVGFIRKLPTHLIASFRTTLNEAANADILLHLVDISHPFFRDHIKTVNETLESLKINDKPIILAFNKIDLRENFEGLKIIETEYPNSIFISAKREVNIHALLSLMQNKYDEFGKALSFTLPYSDMSLINDLYTQADILSRNDHDEGVAFEVKIRNDKLEYFMSLFGKYIDTSE